MQEEKNKRQKYGPLLGRTRDREGETRRNYVYKAKSFNEFLYGLNQHEKNHTRIHT